MSVARRVQVFADLSNFASGKWVHYTDHAMLTINLPKRGLGGPFHQDVAGIYFFPAEFKPWPSWLERKYKFTVRLKPNTPILDLAHLQQDELEQIMRAAGSITVQPYKGNTPGTPYQQSIYQVYLAETKQYPPKNLAKRIDMAWDILRRTLGVNKLTARWNKILRAAGYAAIFDDIKAVHSNETQLIVLDPRVLTDIKRENNTPSAYQGMQQVIKDISNLAQHRYAITPTVDQPKRDNRYHTTPLNLVARIELQRTEHNYANFRVYYDPQYNKRRIIGVTLSWAEPKPDYGVGLVYNFASREYEHDGLIGLQRELDKIFTDSKSGS